MIENIRLKEIICLLMVASDADRHASETMTKALNKICTKDEIDDLGLYDWEE